jgi:hypothetical protein
MTINTTMNTAIPTTMIIRMMDQHTTINTSMLMPMNMGIPIHMTVTVNPQAMIIPANMARMNMIIMTMRLTPINMAINRFRKLDLTFRMNLSIKCF